MATAAPIKLQEQVQLSSVGVQVQALNFQTTTMEADNFIVIREATSDGARELVVVDLSNPLQPTRRPMSVDAAVMNPGGNIVAVRTGNDMLLFDLEKRADVKSATLADEVVFCKWLNAKTLGIVTRQSVYHWKLGDEAEPALAFQRHDSLTSSQVINYIADDAEEWLCLVGIEALDNGLVGGHMQLYSVDKQMSQAIEGHAGAFARLKLEGFDSTLFVFASLSEQGGSKLHIIEVGYDKRPQGAPPFEKRSTDIFYPPEAAGDFPVALQVSSKFSIVYLVTKFGYVHLYDLDAATPLYSNRVSETTLFLTAPHEDTGGLLGVNRGGQVLLVTINADLIVPYVLHSLKDVELAARLASRNGFPGADNMFVEQFSELFDGGRYREAAIVAAESPSGVLRTADTLARFKALPAEDGQPSPLLSYLQVLLERDRLNRMEALELGQLVVRAGRGQLLEKWLRDDKLECSEELGDLVANINAKVALGVYIRAKAHMKVITSFVAMGQLQRVPEYIQRVDLKVDQTELVQRAASVNPQAALELANLFQQRALVVAQQAQSTEYHYQMFDMFVNQGLLHEGTNYCLDNLGADLPEYGELQTKVLELNLMNQPQVADAILSQDIWHRYDKHKVAVLCERQGLFQHAMENYTDVDDVKRVMMNTHIINGDFLLAFFGTLSPEDALECLRALMEDNPRGNLMLCVNIAGRYGEKIGVKACMELFAKAPNSNAQYLFLGQLVNHSDDPEVHFRYIEASVKLQQFGETERVTRESNYYDPERVKSYLMKNKVRDPRPLINVCDRFGYVEEMVRYFMKNGQNKFAEGFVQRINPSRAPLVIGVLMDLDYDEKALKKLMMSVKNLMPMGELLSEVEKRGKVRMLQELAESLIADGSTDEEVHSAAAMVYVDANINAEHFLQTNAFYNSRRVGGFVEKRDPLLAAAAYRRGQCDAEMYELCTRHSLYKQLARYLVDRQSADLWARALNPANQQHRKLIIDQVTSSALMETKEPEKVASTVKAFVEAQLPEVLIELLERLTLQTSTSAFARNRNLQNLLILTAMRADRGRVAEFIRRLDNFDADEVAGIALDGELYEEAFLLYNKIGRPADAVRVLLERLRDFKRAAEYAMKQESAAVWSVLGEAQLEDGQIGEGVGSLLKAKDFAQYERVIRTAQEHGSSRDYAAVLKYLRAARNKVTDVRAIDTEIVYALCRTEQFKEVEEFLARPNAANLDDVTERVYDEERWNAAKLMCRVTKNFAKLAGVNVRLGQLDEALKCARQADRPETWKVVLYACVDAREFRFAQICGQKVIVETGQLPDVIAYYERRGFAQEAIELLESGLSLDRATPQMFTELGVLISRYRESRMMDFCKMWWQRFSVPRVIRACEAALLWAEKCYLHQVYGEFDQALETMMEHSPDAWQASMFTDVVSKVTAMALMYRAIDFYVAERPELLNDLLFVLAPKCEPTTALARLRAANTEQLGELGMLPLTKAFLRKAQEKDIEPINDAVNDVLLLEENAEELSDSVNSFKSFEHVKLARKLEKHRLLEFRRLAAELYRRVGRYEQAVELCKADRLYRDAIEAVAASKDQELGEALAEFFLQNGLRECFTAILYSCYDFLRPDIALELAWRYDVMDFSMPFMIQTMKEVGVRIFGLEEDSKDKREAEAAEGKRLEDEINDDPSVLLFGVSHHNLDASGRQQGGQPLALTYGASGQPQAMAPQIMWHGGAGGGGGGGGYPGMSAAQAYMTQQMYMTQR